MNGFDDDPNSPLGRLLSDAFDAQARGAVGDHAAPPPPRFADPVVASGGTAEVTGHRSPQRRDRTRIWAPLAAAAAVVAIVAGALVVTGRSTDDKPDPIAAPSSSSAPTSTSTSTPTPSSGASSSVRPSATQVAITTLNSDGVTYGAGMPVIAYFSKKITDGRAFQAATKVTANGKPLDAAWYFQRSKAGVGPIEGHLRPQRYWPAHSKIHVEFPAAGTSLGAGLTSDGKLAALDFTIGEETIATVDNVSHTLTVRVDGKETGTYPVSLGTDATPTQRGIKVIMEKGKSISMRGPGYYEASVKDTQRLTYGGEYLHAAPWNIANITKGKNTSNGCTNLRPSDADKLYGELRVGDIVTFPNANGPRMQLGQGYGDWNVPWGEWQTGGLVRTS